MLVGSRCNFWLLCLAFDRDPSYQPFTSALYNNIFCRAAGWKFLAENKRQTMRPGKEISQQCSITSSHPFILSFAALWSLKASKRHPSRCISVKQVERRGKKGRKETGEARRGEGRRFGRVLSSGQRTMQSWQSRCLVPEGIECHMVPLMSWASLEGDVGHNARWRVCLCLLFVRGCVYARPFFADK